MNRTTPLAIAALAAASLAAGCGSSSSSSSSSGTLSKQDFQKRANAICKQYNANVNKLGAPSGFADVEPFARKAIAETDKALTKLRALKPPQALQSDFQQWLSYADQLHDTANKLIAAAKKKDAKALQAAGNEASARDKKSRAIAHRLGLTDCAAG
jgi:hypothetical protein